MKTFLLILVLTVAAFGQQKVVGPINLDGAINGGTSAVGTDSYAITTSSEASLRVKAYAANQCFTFTADVTNTGAASLAVDGLTAKTIKKAEGGVTTDLANNEIRAGQVVTACYDGTNLQMQSRSGVAASGDTTSVSNSGASGASVLKTSTNVTARKLVAGTNVTVTENTDDITIAASGGSDTPLTGFPWLPFGFPDFTPSNDGRAASANGGAWRYLMTVPVTMDFTAMRIYLYTAQASSGLRFALLDGATATIQAKTDAISTATTGYKVFTWQSGSGSLMSGSTLRLAKGHYYLTSCTDNAGIRVAIGGVVYGINIISDSAFGGVGGGATNPYFGYRDSSCTGTGTSVDFNASSYASGWNGYGPAGPIIAAFLP